MEEIVAKPERAYGVRGCLFSFLMPWEKLHADINRVFGEGDVTSFSAGMYGQVDNINCCFFAFQNKRIRTHRCDDFRLAIHRKKCVLLVHGNICGLLIASNQQMKSMSRSTQTSIFSVCWHSENVSHLC